MIVLDDVHLAWWERSKRGVLENLSHDKRVCVIYANFKAQRDGVLESGFLRFFGSAELHDSGSVREAIFASLLPREQTHVGAEAGIGVLVKIDKAIRPFLVFIEFTGSNPIVIDEVVPKIARHHENKTCGFLFVAIHKVSVPTSLTGENPWIVGSACLLTIQCFDAVAACRIRYKARHCSIAYF